MILWFAGTALVAMWFTFRDPAVDHRLIIAGALLPDLIDLPSGGVWVAHSLLVPTIALCGVMALTGGRRLARRRYLAVPIGMFFHLVFDLGFRLTEVFWWPFLGVGFDDKLIPAFDRPLWAVVVLELLGAGALLWVYRRFGLSDPARRRVFSRSGRVDRALTDPPVDPPTC